MKLKLTLQRTTGEPADLTVTVDQTTTVGELAAALVARDPQRHPQRQPQPGGSLTLLTHDRMGRQRSLPAAQSVERCGLRSGAHVAVAEVGRHYAEQEAGHVAGVLRVLDGPDRGREFPLRPGTNIVGRDRGSDVCLTDPLVSKRHAKVNLADVVEIVDNNSSNGVYVGGGQVGRARLDPGSTAILGDTTVTVVAHGAGGGAGPVQFNRSPRLDPVHEGIEHEAPEPPKRPQRRHFPIVSMVAPLLLGAVLYSLTKSVLSLVFIGLAPLMMGGAYLEEMWSSRRSYRAALAAFRTEVAGFDATLHAAADVERAARQAEHPAVRQVLEAALHRTPLLWTRRPEHGSFLDVRVGLGTRPSRDTVKLPVRQGADPVLGAQLTALSDRSASISDVPVVCRFAESGGLGVAGPRSEAVAVAWGLVAQLVTLHSPAELVLAAVLSTSSARQWGWLKWLPHTSSAHSPLAAPHLSTGGAGAAALVGALEELVAQRAADSSRAAPLPAVVVLVEDDTEATRARLVGLAERGPAQHVHVFWVAAAVEHLPAACRTFVAVDDARVGFVRSGDAADPVTFEPLDEATVEQLARGLAPVVDAGALVDDASGLPRTTSFVALANAPVDRSVESVLDRWKESGSLTTGPHAVPHDPTREPSLRALVGATGVDEPFHLDLRVHGPHALVGGTTGAGKSELLQAWILGMASALSPQRVTFLFVDYKGGSAFGACQDLPHSVGLVTDLDPRLVHRALTSLRAELTYREHVLNRYAAKDVVELERADPQAAPPRLVIVVDEFAALKQEIPEFVDGVVDIAQRGRSLGLHLILATQRPTGVITETLRANTNLRVALRMADEADSTDVLGTPVAAGFDPSIPGRAVAKTGPGRLVTFQAAYAGGWTDQSVRVSTVSVQTLACGPTTAWIEPKPATRPARHDPGPNDIRRVVTVIAAAHTEAGLPRPRLPWLPELPAVVELRNLLRAGHPDGLPAIPIGTRDLPREQRQPTAYFQPDRDGNLVVYGTGGTGKSTVLRSVALAALSGPAGPCHVYGIELGTRGLAMLEPLPQVGAVIRGADTDRLLRLLDLLRDTIDERAVRFARSGASTIVEHWRSTGHPDDPRIVLLVDGMGALAQLHQPGSLHGVYEKLLGIATDGRPVGVHVVVSADRPGSVPSSLVSALQCRVVLRLAGADDYGMLGLRPDVLAQDACPGRGLLGKDEFQVGVYGGASAGEQVAAIQALAAASAAVPPAPPVHDLAEHVALRTLPPTVDGLPVFALDKVTLSPVTLRPAGTFMVTGPSGSGRSTAVLTLVTAVRLARPATRVHLLSAKPVSALGDRTGWTTTANGIEAVASAAAALAAQLPGAEPAVVVVEGLNEFAYTPAEAALQAVVKLCQDGGHLLVGEGEINGMTKGGVLNDLVRAGRTGLVLQPQSHQGMTLQTEFPKGLRLADFPPGRGLHVVRGATAVVQVAVPD